MKRHGLPGIILLLLCGCSQSHRYEVDLTSLRGFDWNGKVVVSDRDFGLIAGWKTEQIEFESKDGSTFIVVPRYGDMEFVRVGDEGPDVQKTVTIRKSGWWYTRRSESRRVECRVRPAPTTQPSK